MHTLFLEQFFYLFTTSSPTNCLPSESQPKVKHFVGQVFWGHLENGDRARAGTRPVSEYGPGARRGQPGEVPGLPDQRGRRGESVRNMNVPVFSLDLHFEPLVFRRFGRRQERRQGVRIHGDKLPHLMSDQACTPLGRVRWDGFCWDGLCCLGTGCAALGRIVLKIAHFHRQNSVKC